MKKTDLRVGDKVHYVPSHLSDEHFENGIVKELGYVNGHVRVVYNCGGDWDNYQNYNSSLTRVDDLREGWK